MTWVLELCLTIIAVPVAVAVVAYVGLAALVVLQNAVDAWCETWRGDDND